MTGTNFSTSVLGGYLFQRGVCEIELLTVYSYTRPRNALLYMLRKIQGSFLTVILDTEMGEAIYKFP